MLMLADLGGSDNDCFVEDTKAEKMKRIRGGKVKKHNMVLELQIKEPSVQPKPLQINED